MSEHTPPYKRPFQQRRVTVLVVGTFIALLGVFLLNPFSSTEDSPEDVGLVEVYNEIESGDVVSAELDDNNRSVTITLADDRVLTSNYPQLGGSDLIDALRAAGITDTEVGRPAQESSLSRIAVAMIPLLFIGVLLLFFMKRATGGMMNFSSSNATEAELPDVSFSDVIGAPEAVADLQEVVSVLAEPDQYVEIGARVPKGVLLVGPPGVGKTLIAKAVAAEAGVPFFAVTGSDFVEMFAGVGARRVRDLFKQARKVEKAVIFIDEIDAVGRRRTDGPSNGGTEERESTLNALLTQMDGFEGGNIVVLAATNRAELLDQALTRAGRFDREVQVPLPDRGGRAALFEFYLRDALCVDGFDAAHTAEMLSRRTTGVSGADIANIVNEAKLIAASESSKIDVNVMSAAVERVSMGRERRSTVMTELERRIVAHHEAGHTVTAMMQTASSDPMSVSIVPRGGAGGVTWLDPGDQEHFRARSTMVADLVVAMGGRAAEKLLLDGDYTQGASSDIKAATDRATAMVCAYGMSDLGLIAIDPSRLMGDDAIKVRGVVQDLIERSAADADRLCSENYDLLEAIANRLLEVETLSRDDLHDILAEVQVKRAADGLNGVSV